MTLSYAFGGNTGQSYDALQRRRAYLEAAQKAGQSAPKTAGEGILNGLNSVFSDLMLRKLGKQEDANREAANQKALDLFGQPSQYGGGGASVPAYVPPDPNSPSQLGHDTMVALGKAPATPTKDEMSAYIAAKATELGIDPSVAVAVANSEGLNANPAEGWQSRVVKNGQREPSYGPFQLYMGGGLGNNFLEQTGLDPRDPTTWQKQVDFALGHAKNNGWESWYGARNAGIGDFQGIGGQPQGASGIDPKIVAAMSDPYVSPEIKSALGVLLQQRIAAAQPPDPMDALELEKAKLEVDRLKNPGPPESVTTRLMLAKQAGLQPGTPEYSTYMATGELPKPQEPVKPIEINNKLVDPTTGKVIGDYGTPDPGFRMLTPEEAAAMGLPPGAYQVGPDNKISEIGGGGTSVTVNNNGDAVPNDAALMKALGEGEGKAWSGYLDSGTTSSGMVQDLDLLDQIITMAPQGPVQGRLASMFPGVNSAADAFTSIVKRVAPTLKTAGSGSTSDIEYDGMLKSLPQLSSRPEANVAISKMMRAKAEINMARASIVRDVQNGQLSVTDGRRKMSELDKQSIMTPELKEILANLAPAKTPPAPASNAKQPAKISSDAEYDALKSGDVFIGPDGQTRRKP